jgi:hypothetical protein
MIIMPVNSWTDYKALVATKKMNLQYAEYADRYELFSSEAGIYVWNLVLLKDAGADVTEFESDYKPTANDKAVQDVVTAMEVDDKNLRTFCAFADTDINGEAEICVPIPAPGRWVAYGDAEFGPTRHMGDYVEVMEVTDLDRLIAWQIALSIDPQATAPVSDATVQAAGYPLYPVVGHFDERGFPGSMPPNAKGDIKGGMAMTFQYGATEAQPVGGYAFIPEGFYFRVVGKKVSGQTTGFTLAVSIDWAEPK